jgi:hypothetical protein
MAVDSGTYWQSSQPIIKGSQDGRLTFTVLEECETHRFQLLISDVSQKCVGGDVKSIFVWDKATA